MSVHSPRGSAIDDFCLPISEIRMKCLISLYSWIRMNPDIAAIIL